MTDAIFIPMELANYNGNSFLKVSLIYFIDVLPNQLGGRTGCKVGSPKGEPCTAAGSTAEPHSTLRCFWVLLIEIPPSWTEIRWCPLSLYLAGAAGRFQVPAASPPIAPRLGGVPAACTARPAVPAARA